jgi:hypothetical protein
MGQLRTRMEGMEDLRADLGPSDRREVAAVHALGEAADTAGGRSRRSTEER